MSPTHRRFLTIAAASAFALWAVLVLAGLPSDRGAVIISNVGQCVAPALAALGCVLASRRAISERHRLGWKLLAASALSWSLGQVVWTYYEVSGAAAPFPSLADVGYLLAVPLALGAVWMMSVRSSTSSWMVALLDALIIAGGLLAISWPLVLGPAWDDASSSSIFEFALTLAYPVGDLVVVSAVLLAIMRTDRERDAIPLLPIALGLIMLGLADSIFVWTSMQGTEQAVSLADLGWTAGYLIVLLAAAQYPLPVASGRAEVHVAPSLRRAALPLTVVSMAWMVRMLLVATDQPEDRFLTVLTVMTVALVLIRFLMTMRENQDLTESLEEKIGELTAREQQLSHQALHDPLTGLANRRLFSDRVEHALNRSRRTGDLSAVLFIDLDDFKTVNDSLGHAAGDRLLASVAARMSGCVRPGDTVARLGGDEFGILLEEMEGPEHASHVARRILESLDVAFPLDGRQVFTRASVGVAVADSTAGYVGADLLSDADVALYAAKGSGKSTFREFERTMRVTAIERLELGQDLRQALHQDQFFCHYQPIVDLVTGRVAALEALLRWDHPHRGLVGPNSFIELAEETGMIGEIGMAVLQMSCWQAANWRAEGKVPAALELHVNLSGRQLEDPYLVEKVKRVLASTGFPGSLLVLEITESVAVETGAAHLDLLEQLKGLGIRFAIDDFGTGYSSLNYLRALPVDVLKIDRAFAQTENGQTDTVLLEAIVRLGHSLGIDMIAEGIEHEEQAITLRRLGCRRAQGFLFHRPLSVSEIPQVVAGVPRPVAEPAPPRIAPT
ncbi:putative bifunctional diguanylate cyclase/phosphodiesterase [Aquihabitans daechungensis]|uniref:putative bifunctional diguanylate cyclase/phosphodiesterase n=1 Tax=Aquihabitans daechungensis TaxID=1052257 RepID=UPI003BA10BC2